jgi:hypothetical protein
MARNVQYNQPRQPRRQRGRIKFDAVTFNRHITPQVVPLPPTHTRQLILQRLGRTDFGVDDFVAAAVEEEVGAGLAELVEFEGHASIDTDTEVAADADREERGAWECMGG